MPNKNFIVKHGIEVDGNLIYANSDTNRVGIKTSTPSVELDVAGDIAANNLNLSQNLNLTGNISLGGSFGNVGSYVTRTNDGVVWAPTPGMRTLLSVTATTNQSLFNVVYNVSSGVDVFINGARLSASDYIANNGSTIILNVPCFGGETVDIIAYTVFGTADVRLFRTIINHTTATIAADTFEDFVISGGKSFQLLSLTASTPTWARFYGTSSARSADSRLSPGGSSPLPGTEFYAELLTSSNNQTIRLSPVPTIQTTNGQAFVRIKNVDTVSRSITFTFNILILEE